MAKRTPKNHVVTTVPTMGLPAGPRCCVYNRVSTSGQDPMLAMDDLRRAAIQRGYTVALEVAETGSGKRNDRAGLQRVLEGAQRGEFAAVLVMRLDRFGRSSLDLLHNIRSLATAGCRFTCIEQAIDVAPNGDPMGQLVLTVLAGVAQFEHSIISARVKEGQRRAQERGVEFGRPREDGPSGDAVRALRAAGASWSTIAVDLECSVAMARRRHDDAAA